VKVAGNVLGKYTLVKNATPPRNITFPNLVKNVRGVLIIMMEWYVTDVSRTFVKSAFPSSNMMLKKSMTILHTRTELWLAPVKENPIARIVHSVKSN
jgi:hypothetical protein